MIEGAELKAELLKAAGSFPAKCYSLAQVAEDPELHKLLTVLADIEMDAVRSMAGLFLSGDDVSRRAGLLFWSVADDPLRYRNFRGVLTALVRAPKVQQVSLIGSLIFVNWWRVMAKHHGREVKTGGPGGWGPLNRAEWEFVQGSVAIACQGTDFHVSEALVRSIAPELFRPVRGGGPGDEASRAMDVMATFLLLTIGSESDQLPTPEGGAADAYLSNRLALELRRMSYPLERRKLARASFTDSMSDILAADVIRADELLVQKELIALAMADLLAIAKNEPESKTIRAWAQGAASWSSAAREAGLAPGKLRALQDRIRRRFPLDV